MTSPIPNQRGHVLLLAAAPRAERRRLLDPEAGTAAIGSVPASLLLGSSVAADAVTLVDPAQPQAVLGRLRTAAATPGPLFLYLAGQLVTDRRQHQLHLALADTTALNIRYSALPWSWIGRELQQRPPGARTAVLVDLVAEAGAWTALQQDQGELQMPPGVELWGVVCPPPGRRQRTTTAYTRVLAELLRTGTGRAVSDLHPMAAGQAHLPPDVLLLAPMVVPELTDNAFTALPVPPPRPAVQPWPVPATAVYAPPPIPTVVVELADPRPAIAEALRSGRHTEAGELAADWERHLLRTRGPQARELADVAEVQAQIAVAVGNLPRAVERWIATAQARLAWTTVDHPDVAAAVDNAHALWSRLDQRAALQLGTALVELRRAVPGDARRLQSVQRRLEQLHSGELTAPQTRARM